MYKRIVVPLDGSTLAESVVSVVTHMAEKLSARVQLLSVVDEEAAAAVSKQLTGKYGTRAPVALGTIA